MTRLHVTNDRGKLVSRRRPQRDRVELERPVIYSLCDASGVWSRPYAEAGFEVVTVDLANGQDVRLLEYPRHPVYGVLAAPPCTVFSRASGKRHRSLEETAAALAVVDACLRFIVACRPTFWALENPPGQLDRWLGPPSFSFQPWEYGDPWTKRTYLWGSFNVPVKSPVVPATCGVDGRPGEKPALGWSAVERAVTPPGFARAFFEANRSGAVLPEGDLWLSRTRAEPRW